MKNNLYCTFVTEDYLPIFLKNIKRNFKVKNNKIFIMEVIGSPEKQFVCTYNLDEEDPSKLKKFFKKTISLHRKKETNTFYTINALNHIVYEKIGRLDNTYKIDWKEFPNTLLLLRENELVKIPIKHHKVYVIRQQDEQRQETTT